MLIIYYSFKRVTSFILKEINAKITNIAATNKNDIFKLKNNKSPAINILPIKENTSNVVLYML